MPKKKTPELDPREQFKRFQEAVKDAGVAEKTVETAFKRLAAAKHKKTVASTK